MLNHKIVHVMHNEKFVYSFIEFIEKHFSFENHLFLIINGVSDKEIAIKTGLNILQIKEELSYIEFSKLMKKYLLSAEKIILHSLFSNKKNLFFYFNQKLLKKCYWVIWGADLYIYNKPKTSLKDIATSYIRKKVYEKMGHLVTYIRGDYELAQKWYGAKGKYHECFMYPSNLYKEYDIDEIEHTTINIQVGNSADPSNNHFEVFEKLLQYKDEDIKIYVPLSYGDEKYADEIETKGKELFGDKCIAMREFMPFDEYLQFLGKIDIAIFAHKRQQAMGNIITLLGLGKKVYMRSDITPWELFQDIEVKVFDVNSINLDYFNSKEKNKTKIKNYFSKENYLMQLRELFSA